MSRIKSNVDEEPSDSFTSMIDIVFLLLIFFILQPFKAPSLVMHSDLPPRGKGPDCNTRLPISLSVKSSSENPDEAVYSVDGIAFSSDTSSLVKRVGQTLNRRSQGLKDTPVAIIPTRKVHFKHVLAALDACYEAGMTDVRWKDMPDP